MIMFKEWSQRRNEGFFRNAWDAGNKVFDRAEDFGDRATAAVHGAWAGGKRMWNRAAQQQQSQPSQEISGLVHTFIPLLQQIQSSQDQSIQSLSPLAKQLQQKINALAQQPTKPAFRRTA